MIIAGRRQNVLNETAEGLRRLARTLGQSTTVLAVPTDIKIAKQVESLFDEIKKEFGRAADVVIANAGWSSAAKLLAVEDPDAWWNNFVSNFVLIECQ